MSYYAYITRINNIRKHPNADKLQLGECFGNTVCVGLNYYEGQMGIYFPEGGQLSVEFAEINNLIRKKDKSGNNVGGYLDPQKRNIKAIRLRGEQSDGLFLPLKSLEYIYDTTKLNIGDKIAVLNGREICCKYIPKTTQPNNINVVAKQKKKSNINFAPLFVEHVDTSQLAYNLNQFEVNDIIEITLKMHGTSQRTAYLPIFKGYKRKLKDRLLRRKGIPVYDWGYVSGTKRTVLKDYAGGFYGVDKFREPHAQFFEDKLKKGEEVYYEVVGYLDSGKPIMPSVSNKLINDKEFVKQYGDTTTFSYGCKAGDSDFYVYRMTMTNEDGEIIEYTPDYVRYRCEQMGCKSVPVLFSTILTLDDVDVHKKVRELAENFYDGIDPIGKTHIREGVVVRIVNRPTFTAFKHKNYNFKVLSGIAAEQLIPFEISEDIIAEI